MSDDRPYYRRRSTGAVVQLLRTDTYETGPAVCYLRTGTGLKPHVCTQEVLEREYELLHNDDPDMDLLVRGLHEQIAALSAELATVKHEAAVHERWVRIYRSQRLEPLQRLQAKLDRRNDENSALNRKLKAAEIRHARMKEDLNKVTAGVGVMTVRAHKAAKTQALTRCQERLETALRELELSAAVSADLSAQLGDMELEVDRLRALTKSGYTTLVEQHLDGLEAHTRQEVLGLTLQSWVPLIVKIADVRVRRCRLRT